MKITFYFLFILFMTQFMLTSRTQTQWTPIVAIPPGGGITDMVVTGGGNIIVTRGSFNYPNGQPGGISWSSNQGGSWISPVNVFTARTLELGPAGGGLDIAYASVWNYPSNEALYRTISGGLSWTGPHYSVGANDNIFAIEYVISNTLFIGTRNGVLKSTNGGTNFFSVNNGIPPNSWVYDLDASDTNGLQVNAMTDSTTIAAATTNGVFFSTNLGSNWHQPTGIPSTDTVPTVIFYKNSFGANRIIGASISGKIFVADNLMSFTQVNNFPDERFEKCVPAPQTTNIYFTSRPRNSDQIGGGIFLSTDGGVTLTPFSQGLPQNPVVSSLAMRMTGSSLQLYAGLYNNTMNGGVTYKRTVPIGIEPISSEIPRGFSLSQNYPNPFNPTTNIEFALPKASFVKLVIYDLLGREISRIVNEELRSGIYEADWDASNYPSGVYFYRLETDDFTETKKMILVK